MKYKELKELLKEEQEKTKRLEAELNSLRESLLVLIAKYSVREDGV